MNINEYKLDGFGHSEKALWLVGRWCTPELRLPPRYKNIFIPISQCAIKYSSVFIPEWLVNSITEEHLFDDYKIQFPSVMQVYGATKDEWDKFREMYPYKEDNLNV